MSSIKADHITGQQPAHQGGQWNAAGSEKKMGVIGHESPGVAGDPAFEKKKRKTLDQIVAILIAPEYVASFYPPDDHMMQNTRGILAGLPGHTDQVTENNPSAKLYNYLNVPKVPLRLMNSARSFAYGMTTGTGSSDS